MNNLTRSWIELGVTCAASAAGAACVVIAAKFAPNPGDVLGFFGGMLGAFFAVAGGLYLQRKEKEESATGAIKSLERGLLFFLETAKRLGTKQSRREVRANAITVQQAWNILDTAAKIGLANSNDIAFTGVCQNVIHWTDQVTGMIQKFSNDAGSTEKLDEIIESQARMISRVLAQVAINYLKMDVGWSDEAKGTLSSAEAE